jgi:hypothetical protein
LNIEKIKVEYEKLRKEYALPEFYELNKLFDIEEIEMSPDFLLRKIRRVISERISACSRFIELMLNPNNAPMFLFKIIKKIDKKDKESLAEIYGELGNIEIGVITLDLDYSERREAEFIKKTFEDYNNDLRLRFLNIIKKLEDRKEDKKEDKEGSEGYLG